MSRPVYRDLPEIPLPDALRRGREDLPWFSWYFLRRKLHDGQADFLLNAQATINCLPTSNRWGKTAGLAIAHYHACFFKTGGEPEYTDLVGNVDMEKYLRLRYFTVHTADLWDTASMVWQDALKIYEGSERLQPFVKATPKTLPPKIVFLNGAEWFFRAIGDNGQGIDGYSFYLVSVDEAGWIKNLEQIIEGVGRLRVADVDGRIVLAGTMKVGISRPFYRYAHRAAVETGASIGLDHRDGRDYRKQFDAEIARARARGTAKVTSEDVEYFTQLAEGGA